jgi:DHA3 family tetracycline resistance protein-like MFS transporter
MKRLDAYPTYLFLNGMDGLTFSLITTVSLVYQVTMVGLDPLQLVLVGTTLELAAFLFEVPTGIVADVYSRRLSIIIGYVLIGIGFLVEGSFPFFATVLIAQVLWGLGYTFTSGATEAWISDEIGEANAGRAFLRASQVARFGTFVGIIASIVIGNVGVNLPIIIGGVCYIVLAIALVLVMPETGFHPTPREDRNSFQQMWHTFRGGLAMVKRRPVLTTILGVGIFHGLYSEGVDRLWTPFVLLLKFPELDGLTTVTWFGIIRIGSILLGIAANEIAHRRVNTTNEVSIRRALFGINAAMVLSLIVFAASPNIWIAIIAQWAWSMLRQTHNPLYTTWVNQRLDSNVRATVISMSAQADEIGQVVGGPIVGVIGTVISLRVALLASAAILSPVLALFARTTEIADSRPQTAID